MYGGYRTSPFFSESCGCAVSGGSQSEQPHSSVATRRKGILRASGGIFGLHENAHISTEKAIEMKQPSVRL